MKSEMIERFNRETVWLATGVLGTVVFAALVLAVQERLPRKFNSTEERVQAGGDLLQDSTSAALFKDVRLSGISSTGKMTSAQASSVDHALTEISPKENRSSQIEPTASTPTSVLAFTPEKNRNAHRQDSARVIRSKIRNVRDRMLRSLDVKRRLLLLWHQSLARSEKSRNWTAFSN